MPGDPLRAKMIAENFLTDVECFNQTRGMLGYTGNYQGKRVSVMGHGMGIPSIGIYTYELFSFYDVENIIRIGSIGGLDTSLNLGDVIIAQGACTDSNYASQYGLPGTFAPICDYGLLKLADQTAERRACPCGWAMCWPATCSTVPIPKPLTNGAPWAFWAWRWNAPPYT